MLSVYCYSVTNFARVAAPLNFRKGNNQLFEFELNDIERDTFQEFKERLIFLPI